MVVNSGAATTLGAVLKGAAGASVSPADAAVSIADMTEDSNSVQHGACFVARKGGVFDGAAYIADAVRRGAAAVLADASHDAACRAIASLGARQPFATVPGLPYALPTIAERFFGSPSSSLCTVGVTGSNGKTTVGHLVRGVLGSLGVGCGLVGSVQVDTGAGVSAATLTTPPAIELSRSLAAMVSNGCAAAAVEASSQGLDQGRAAGVAFRVGVFTNLTREHQDYHKTMGAYAAAKAALFRVLPSGGTAVINADDSYAAAVLGVCAAPVVRCSMLDGSADVYAKVLGETPEGSRVQMRGAWGRFDAQLRLFGAHNAMNALQAVAASHAVCASIGRGVCSTALCAAVESVSAPAGRLERVGGNGCPVAVYVDYAHTDDALAKALAAVRLRLNGGALWAVFGASGDRDRVKRPRMGRIAVDGADRVVVTSDNARTEDPSAIINEVLAGVPQPELGRTVSEPARGAAIRYAIENAAPGDAIVIAGKGHETYQLLADPSSPGGVRRTDFDDRVFAAEVLRERFGG